jgi:hypothetical protein
MLTQEVLLQLQKYNVDLLARHEPSGRRRLRYMALGHIKDGKSASETALALHVTPPAVIQWLKWFVDKGLDRVAGIPITGVHSDFPRRRKKPFARQPGSCRTGVAAAVRAARLSDSCWTSSLAWLTPSMASMNCSSGST